MSTLLAVVGRVLIALLFIVSGANKLADLAGTRQMLGSVGLSGDFAVGVAIFEIVAGLALVFGVMTRFFALLLAAFCLLTAFFFHHDFLDPIQAAMLLKNVAVAGGLLCLCAVSTLRWSYDDMRERRRRDLAEREAELRAARAEGKLESHQLG